MSTVKVDTLVASDGTSPVTLTKQSAAKMLCTFNGTGTIAIRTSFGVSSIDDDATGQYGVNFTSAMSGTEFTPTGSNIGDSTTSLRTVGVIAGLSANTTTSINFASTEVDATSAYTDWTHINTVVHGDLA